MSLKPKVKAPHPYLVEKTAMILQKEGTNTICMESKCPNIAECFERGTATFLIMGTRCTRKCSFCNVSHGTPAALDPKEPVKIARAVQKLGLRYVVITSVDRDDIEDYGASHFFHVCQSIRRLNPDTKIELLTPDFQGDEKALETIVQTDAYKLAHNVETIERLTKKIMPGSRYHRSLEVLRYYATSGAIVKSSLMVGLGETKEELIQTFEDLAKAGVRHLTIGQYLQPSTAHHPVIKYYRPHEFDELAVLAKKAGIEAVVSGALVRSSYYADIL